MIAWGTAAALFLAATAVILATRPVFVARARADISRAEVSTGGLARVERIDFNRANRTLPMDFVARLKSRATIQLALDLSALPHGDGDVDAIESSIGVRLIPGTTLIETIVTSRSRETARALAGALFAGHEALRRERRERTLGGLLAALDGAARDLDAESRTLAGRLAQMDVYRPAAGAGSDRNMNAAFIERASDEAHLRAALERLDAIDTAGPESLMASLPEAPLSRRDASHFSENAGDAVLRANLAARLGELAGLRSAYGPGSGKVRQAQSGVGALQQMLRSSIAAQKSQLRSQLDAVLSSGSAIDARIRSRQDAAKAVRAAEISPEYEELTLKQEGLREEWKAMTMRRRELLVAREVDEPSLIIVQQPAVSAAPEDRHRGARFVFAGFGALLVGISLSIILGPRTLAAM